MLTLTMKTKLKLIKLKLKTKNIKEIYQCALMASHMFTFATRCVNFSAVTSNAVLKKKMKFQQCAKNTFHLDYPFVLSKCRKQCFIAAGLSC